MIYFRRKIKITLDILSIPFRLIYTFLLISGTVFFFPIAIIVDVYKWVQGEKFHLSLLEISKEVLYSIWTFG